MRSKLIVWGYLVILSLGTMLSLYMPKTEAAAKESIVIPGEAIRLRILANSDFEEDQAIKRKVRDAVNAQITVWVQDLTSMEDAKKVMTAKLPEIQAIAEKVVHEQGSDQSVKVDFGKVQFPTKLYGQFLYPAGEYQAILITLGSGEGANWWCVLYPPLCFLDFSNGVAVSDGFEEKKVAKAKTVDSKEVIDEPVIEAEPEPADEPYSVPVTKTEPESTPVIKTEPKSTPVRKAEPVKEKAAVSKVEVKAEVSVDKTVVEKVEPVKEETDVKEAKKQQVEVKKQTKQVKKDAPVYTAEDEEPVKVKFFVVEMWDKMFK